MLRRLEEARAFVLRAEAVREEKQSHHRKMEGVVSVMRREEEILRHTELAITEIAQKVLGSSTGSIDKLITGGLRAVFKDQDLELRTVIDRYRGKTSMRLELLQGGSLAPLMEGYGGGPVVVIGVLLRVAMIMALGLRRVLLLDESLAMVSEQYIPNVSALLRKLCEQLGFTILLVTHNERFAELADVQYQAQDSSSGTVFVKIPTDSKE